MICDIVECMKYEMHKCIIVHREREEAEKKCAVFMNDEQREGASNKRRINSMLHKKAMQSGAG